MECTKSVHPREGIRFREAVSECGELIRLNDANRVHLSWSGLPSQRPESRLIRLLDVRPASSTLGDKIALSGRRAGTRRRAEQDGTRHGRRPCVGRHHVASRRETKWARSRG